MQILDQKATIFVPLSRRYTEEVESCLKLLTESGGGRTEVVATGSWLNPELATETEAVVLVQVYFGDPEKHSTVCNDIARLILNLLHLGEQAVLVEYAAASVNAVLYTAEDRAYLGDILFNETSVEELRGLKYGSGVITNYQGKM